MLRINQSIGKYLSVGFFGYFGKEDLTDNIGPFTSSIKIFGPDLVLNIDDKFVMNLQYIRRMDSDVFVEWNNSKLQNVLTHGGMAELIFSPKGDMSKWYLTGLLNWVESDFNDLDYRSATLHAGYLLRRNLRLVTEYTYKFPDDPYGKVSAGFISAF